MKSRDAVGGGDPGTGLEMDHRVQAVGWGAKGCALGVQTNPDFQAPPIPDLDHETRWPWRV